MGTPFKSLFYRYWLH